MFTGIIEELGYVKEIRQGSNGTRIEIACHTVLERARAGDSIAVNGVCLTAVDLGKASFSADVSLETLRRTSLGSLGAETPVNLERPLTPSSRFGGHIVQGHIDGTGELTSVRSSGDGRNGADGAGGFVVTIGFQPELGRYIGEKGSIAVDGISLTVASIAGNAFEVAVIPHTWRVTNLSSLKTGSVVNLEVDIIAKYVERMLRPERTAADEGLTIEKLKSLGY